jgi:hypothetical protein
MMQRRVGPFIIFRFGVESNAEDKVSVQFWLTPVGKVRRQRRSRGLHVWPESHCRRDQEGDEGTPQSGSERRVGQAVDPGEQGRKAHVHGNAPSVGRAPHRAGRGATPSDDELDHQGSGSRSGEKLRSFSWFPIPDYT